MPFQQLKYFRNDIVTHHNLTATQRNKVIQNVKNNLVHENESLDQAQFILLNMKPTNNPDYECDFMLARVVGDVSKQDTEDPNC